MRTRIFKGMVLAAVMGLAGCSTPTDPQAGGSRGLQADESIPPPGIPRKYVAPHEFDGDELGTTLSDLKSRHPRLTELGQPTAVEWRGKTRSVDSSGCLQFDQASGGCKQPVIQTDVDGGGTVLLAEYVIAAPYDGYTAAYLFNDTGGVLAPVIIDVCAQYTGHGDRVIPNTLQQDARVCGFRGFHHTYIDEYVNKDERGESDTRVPMYERVLRGLVNVYGYPAHYRPIGQIVIELSDGTQLTSSPSARYIDYHWGRGSPEVSIDYAFNPKDGVGMVLIADGRARFYAQMRHDMGDVNFLLWRLHQPGGMNRKEFESKFQSGSLATTEFDAREEPGQLSERVRALLAAHP
jgi:hypothetical protein